MNHGNKEVSLRKAAEKQTESVELNADQLNQLMQMQQEAVGSEAEYNQPVAEHVSKQWRIAFIAVFAAFAGVLLAMFIGGHNQSGFTDKSMLARIADEVAKNHLALKPMEVRSGAMQDIRGYFKELDFQPTQSQLLASSDAKTLGGRYCSIGGNIAAQLRVEDPEGGLHTLYQVRYDPERFGVIPNLDAGEPVAHASARGVPVRIWREKGLLFAITGE